MQSVVVKQVKLGNSGKNQVRSSEVGESDACDSSTIKVKIGKQPDQCTP